MLRGRPTAVALLCLAPLAACQTSGPQIKDAFVAHIEATREGLAGCRDQLETTLQAYQLLVHLEAGDLPDRYSSLTHEIETCDRQIENSLQELDEMERMAQDYFARWSSDLDSYSSDSLRRLSQQRLDLIQQRFATLETTARPARDRATRVVEKLRDHMLFLRYDLTPESVAALSEDVEELQRTGDQLLESLRSTLEVSEHFAESLKSAPNPTRQRPADEKTTLPGPAEDLESASTGS